MSHPLDMLDASSCAPVDMRASLQSPALAGPTQDPKPHLAPKLHKTVELQDGSTLEIDFYQVASDWWTAKDASHDRRCGHGPTQESAEEDLVVLTEDELELQRPPVCIACRPFYSECRCPEGPLV